jgi:hypothetical protein
MKSYLYAAALVAVVATPTMAAEQLTDNQMDQVSAGWVPSGLQEAARRMPDVLSGLQEVLSGLQEVLSGLQEAARRMPDMTQPSFEVIVNNQGVFITHQGSIDLATLATLPNSAFTVTSNANTIVLSVLH